MTPSKAGVTFLLSLVAEYEGYVVQLQEVLDDAVASPAAGKAGRDRIDAVLKEMASAEMQYQVARGALRRYQQATTAPQGLKEDVPGTSSNPPAAAVPLKSKGK